MCNLSELEAAVESDREKYEIRPVKNKAGSWDAFDGYGYGYQLGYPTKKEVDAWLKGYKAGATESIRT